MLYMFGNNHETDIFSTWCHQGGLWQFLSTTNPFLYIEVSLDMEERLDG
jgi:hypothetical protein